jgi:hypothetical protein
VNLRPTILPACIALALLVIYAALISVPGGWLILEMLSRGTGPLWLVVLGSALVFLFWRRQRISGIAMFASLAALSVLVTAPTPATSFAGKLADLINVAVYGGALQRQLGEARRHGQALTAASIAIDGFGSMASGIAFDPSKEILLPADKRSRAWTDSAGQTELGVDNLEVRHIVGSYYAWFHN